MPFKYNLQRYTMARLQQASNTNAVDLNEARKELERRMREMQRLSVEGARTRVEAAEQPERADDLAQQLVAMSQHAAAQQRQLSEDGNLLVGLYTLNAVVTLSSKARLVSTLEPEM